MRIQSLWVPIPTHASFIETLTRLEELGTILKEVGGVIDIQQLLLTREIFVISKLESPRLLTINPPACWTAVPALIDGNDNPFFGSVSVGPDDSSIVSISLGVKLLFASNIKAAIPAAVGVAIEVPCSVLGPPPIKDAVIGAPGVVISISVLLLVKHVIVLRLVLASKQFASK